jgi:uncharacterized membrane protein
LQTEYPHQLVVIDIDSDETLKAKYDTTIPVVSVGPYELKAPIDEQRLRVSLGAAQDRRSQLDSIGDVQHQGRVARGKKLTGSDRFTYWFSRNYIWVFNLMVLIYIGLPFLAPVLVKANINGPANVIYKVYSSLCHQLAFRSFFVFGEQTVYPREAAGVEGLVTYGQATGLDEADLWAARSFLGNEQMGYKIALCQRDVAIYLAILGFGIVFGLTGRKIRPLHLVLWILIGMAPIGLDGVSQLVSQPPLNLIPYRESIPLFRVLTGALFGLTTAWFGYPLVEEAMADARELTARKAAVVKQTES